MPVEMAVPGFEIPSPGPPTLPQEPEPISEAQPSAVLTEVLPEPAEPVYMPGAESQIFIEKAEEKPVPKQKPRTRKKTAAAGPARAGKGETRKTKSAKEKSKE